MEKRKPPIPDVEGSGEARPAEGGAAPAVSPAETPTLAEQLKKLEEENKALFAQLVRRQADFENFRKRMEREQQEFRQQAEADLVGALLPALDGLERALAAPASAVTEEYRKGVELIYKQLSDVLTRAGLNPVEAVGRPFDPFLHHAVERVESPDHRDQEVLAELQRGYTFKQRLLRPALVRVAVSAHPAAPGKPEPEE